jgi:U3 small nucleolar RNA-associated protein 20
LVPGSLQLGSFFRHSGNLLGNISDIVGMSTEICVENLTWKRANGFLHLVEEIFGSFGMAHISPFLNTILIIVVRLLESCMRNLRRNSDDEYSHKQSNHPDNESSMNQEAGNSIDLKECSKEMTVADDTEVCHIIDNIS